MTILSKLWREFESSKTGEVTSSSQGPTLQVRIPAKLVTTSNHQVMSFFQGKNLHSCLLILYYFLYIYFDLLISLDGSIVSLSFVQSEGHFGPL